MVVLASGKIMGSLFRRGWQKATGQSELPEAQRAESSWPGILAASAGYGALMGVTKAVGDRGGAEGVRKMTGRWPGKPTGKPA
jgi:hypothetical protein